MVHYLENPSINFRLTDGGGGTQVAFHPGWERGRAFQLPSFLVMRNAIVNVKVCKLFLMVSQ